MEIYKNWKSDPEFIAKNHTAFRQCFLPWMKFINISGILSYIYCWYPFVSINIAFLRQNHLIDIWNQCLIVRFQKKEFSFLKILGHPSFTFNVDRNVHDITSRFRWTSAHQKQEYYPYIFSFHTLINLERKFLNYCIIPIVKLRVCQQIRQLLCRNRRPFGV